jgi:hypothetical protein
VRKNLNLIVLGALVVGFCLSLALCFVLFAKLSRIGDGVRMAEERLRAVESRSVALPAEIGRAVGADIEIVRRSLYAAYKVERDDFHASHKNMGGGSYSYAMLCHAEKDFDDGWRKVATNWFYSTARDDFELRLMAEYDVGPGDLKYTRDELRQAMVAWKSVSSGMGRFEGQSVVFTNGVASFTNKKYNCTMELRLLKDQIWAYEGNVYIFASSDVAGNGDYGSSDALNDNWFLRFKGGRIVDCCSFRHGCNAFANQRYHFQADNDRIVITSVKSGDIVGELYLGLIERTDPNGGKSRDFKYEGSHAEE